MQETVNNENGVGFKEFVALVWAKKWIVVAITLAVAIATMIFSMVFTKTTYTASCKMMVSAASSPNNSNGELNDNDINSASKLADTCIVILDTQTFFDGVVKTKLENGQTVGEKYGHSIASLKGSTSFQKINSTGVFELVFVSEDRVQATEIMNVIYDKAQETLADKFGETSVKPVEDVYPPVVTGKNVATKTIIGLVVGALLGVASVFVINLFDVKVRNAESVKNRYNITILGELY